MPFKVSFQNYDCKVLSVMFFLYTEGDCASARQILVTLVTTLQLEIYLCGLFEIKNKKCTKETH